MIRALLIDDEPLAHKVILHHLKAHPDIEVIQQCYNAAEALGYLANNCADLLFLDINMPQLTGIDMLRVLANKPQVIIISAHKEYAFDSFELDVTDYLSKPVSPERLSAALDKVRARLTTTDNQTSDVATELMLKVDRTIQKFTLADITLFEAYGNYVKVWRGEQMSLVTSTLKQLKSQLTEQQFVQVHKSFIVNIKAITTIGSDWLQLSNQRKITVGKSFKGNVRQLL